MLTIELAAKLLPIVGSLIGKIYSALTSKDPVSIEEEIAALETLRIRPADDVIAEADKASK